ncbi:hypothetical protein FF011L_00790 [Roseimaritima multifibrata]|uniref:Carboxypeptidase regulatory-like domain-containing protein n=1 Tax=Roseimaritima multifibrata TaxID=1930274 RepID=A0A517M8Y5_9BACT|nr:carboxypeptidase regulatory-like domain-containing protein [Roseimaritima multifibrata]QDS91350.1 hypothetical protein FF011L_00790 [Roseimaritima multifibrata]
MSVLNRCILFPCLAFSFLAGCGKDGPPLGSVHGVVMHDGKGLANVALEITPTAGGRPSLAVTDEEGKYEAYYLHNRPGALLGEHEISYQMSSPPSDGEVDETMPPPPKANGPKNVKLEPRQITVESGSNEINFELVPKS